MNHLLQYSIDAMALLALVAFGLGEALGYWWRTLWSLLSLILILTVLDGQAAAQEAVSDAVTELNTAQTVTGLSTANTTLSQIAAADLITANSVSTSCDPGLYQGIAQYLDGLEGLLLGTGVSGAAMSALFPGWVPLLPDSIPGNAIIATMGLGAYAAAVQVAQSQAADFDAENTYLASIEAGNVGARGVLCAMQINTEAMLAVATQFQMLRQLMASSLTIEAYDHAENLNEKAQSGATTAQATNLGVPPQ